MHPPIEVGCRSHSLHSVLSTEYICTFFVQEPLPTHTAARRCQIVHLASGGSSQQSCLPRPDDRDPGGRYAPPGSIRFHTVRTWSLPLASQTG